MRISVSHILSEDTADIFGEWLRSKFFIQKKGELGCWDVFSLWAQVDKIEEYRENHGSATQPETTVWKRFYQFCQGYPVLMAAHGADENDPDPVIYFNIDNRWVLSNMDAGKTSGWELEDFTADHDEFLGIACESI